jgi:hypothetical protein
MNRLLQQRVHNPAQGELFLQILPRVEVHAGVVFRRIRCGQARQDAVAETVALAFKFFLAALARGKDPLAFPSAIATFAARQVRCGRRLCGTRTGDVGSVAAAIRHGVWADNVLDGHQDALADNTVTPIPDQVAFRLDFPAWLGTRTQRDREMVGALMAGGRTKDVAERFGLTEGRVSQLRQEFRQDWERFTGGE